METGQAVNLPQAGGVIDQHDFWWSRMKIAWRVWYLEEYKLKNNLAFTQEDNEFMAWVTSDD